MHQWSDGVTVIGVRALARRLLPRVVRNSLRSPPQSLRWGWNEAQHLVGYHPVILIRPGWSVQVHPAARHPFAIPCNDPSQITELNAFIESCHPGMVLFDIGAHFGLFSLAALHYGGPTARAVAVDPSKIAVRMLLLHARLNRVTKRLQIIPAAATTQPGWQAMLPMGVFADGFYIPADPGRRAADLVRVRAVTVDSLVNELGNRPTHLKIDVEGAEADVLGGALRTLSGDQSPLVFLELHNAMCRRAGRNPEDCLAELTRLGYRLEAPGKGELTVERASEPSVIRLIARRDDWR